MYSTHQFIERGVVSLQPIGQPHDGLGHNAKGCALSVTTREGRHPFTAKANPFLDKAPNARVVDAEICDPSGRHAFRWRRAWCASGR